MRPKVSIIVPCWGVEQYLDRCVNSLVNQTLRDIEIILVDDESPDRVPEMCDAWAAKDARIKVVHKKNGGLGMACNSGLDVAAGDYIAFCDSDDWVDEEMYETMHKAVEKYNAQIVYTGIRRVNERGVCVPMAQASELHVYDSKEKIESFMMDMIASRPSVRYERRVQPSAKIVLYERRLITKNNIRFESERQFLSEDTLFNLDVLAKANCVVELPKTFYNYLINTHSITQKLRTDRFEKYIILRNEMLRRYSNILPASYKERVDRMFIGYCRNAIEKLLNGNISTREKKMYLKHIVSHKIWENIASTYPVSKMPIVHRIVFYAILYRQIWLLKFIYKFK